MIEKQDILLEIGCEELPATFIMPALERLEALFVEFCAQNRIEHGPVRTFATPRRLALIADNVSDTQAEMVTEIKGPPAKAALDAQGAFTEAAAKFAQSRGGTVKQLEVRATDKGDYVFLVKKETGRRTRAVLPELPPRLLEKIVFPKNMRWDTRTIRFARPVRWFLLLYGNKAIKFNYQNIPCGAFTYGNRWFGGGKIKIDSAQDYFEKLEASGVIPDHNRRREMIREAVLKLAGGKPYMPDDLLDEVNFLVEYPYAAVGSFPAEFTELPPEVLKICIKKNQHYFPVADPATGRMLPRFVVIMNAPITDKIDVIQGYQKVLNSRLKDAKFFYDEDLKTPLSERVDQLSRITFQEKLGSLLDKTHRVEALVRVIGEACNKKVKDKFEQRDIETAVSAARLMKADLTTQMVFEYGEIQGTVGKYYALEEWKADGCNISDEGYQSWAQAIEEHYMPRFAEDDVPASAAGALLAIADKMDTIVGYFSVGLLPTGSADPYQLRRQALGIIRIVEKYDLPVDVEMLFDLSLKIFDDVIPEDSELRKPFYPMIKKFFNERFENYMKSSGKRYDILNAVNFRDRFRTIPDSIKIVNAITELAEEKDFRDMLEAYTRITNILKQAGIKIIGSVLNAIKEDLFSVVEETNLNITWKAVHSEITEKEKGNASFADRIRVLYKITPVANVFFDNVMVNDKNEDIRKNRLALLQSTIFHCYRQFAEFSLILKEQQQQQQLESFIAERDKLRGSGN